MPDDTPFELGYDRGTVIVAAHADVLAWLAARAADGAVPDTCS